MELTSFILGVCAVIMLLMVVGMFINNTQIKSLKADLENFKINQLYEAGIMRTKVNDNERETYNSISEVQRTLSLDNDKLYRHIDSRVDKTVDNVEQQLADIYRHIDSRVDKTVDNVEQQLADIYRTIDQVDQNIKNKSTNSNKELLVD
jgi:hypothetical protein